MVGASLAVALDHLGVTTALIEAVLTMRRHSRASMSARPRCRMAAGGFSKPSGMACRRRGCNTDRQVHVSDQAISVLPASMRGAGSAVAGTRRANRSLGRRSGRRSRIAATCACSARPVARVEAGEQSIELILEAASGEKPISIDARLVVAADGIESASGGRSAWRPMCAITIRRR